MLKVVSVASAVVSLGLALALGAFLLALAGAPPVEAYRDMLEGALASPEKVGWVITTVVPILLCSAGLLVTFSSGLWNIGVEGQIVAGAILSSWLALSLDLPQPVFVPLLLLAGMLGGAAWALLAGLLKIYGKVNEIFGGVGLNFIAMAATTYLVTGPWKPERGQSVGGTDPFRPEALLPRLGDLPVFPVAVAIAVLAIFFVTVLLRQTIWGLRLKAIGKNPRSTFLSLFSSQRYILGAFALCGALAGITGAVLTLGVQRRLLPGISGGYGFLSILVVLLAGYRPVLVIPIALFFAVIGVGAPRLEQTMGLDSAIGGTLEATIVLFVLLAQGVRRRLEVRWKAS